MAEQETAPLVLYVDDNKDNCSVFCANFQQCYTLEVYTDAQIALERIAKGGVGIIVTDQRMPDLSGNELLRRAKVIQPDVVGVVITAWADFDTLLEAVNEDLAARYLVKPWNQIRLRAAIDDAMEKWHHQDGGVCAEVVDLIDQAAAAAAELKGAQLYEKREEVA